MNPHICGEFYKWSLASKGPIAAIARMTDPYVGSNAPVASPRLTGSCSASVGGGKTTSTASRRSSPALIPRSIPAGTVTIDPAETSCVVSPSRTIPWPDWTTIVSHPPLKRCNRCDSALAVASLCGCAELVQRSTPPVRTETQTFRGSASPHPSIVRACLRRSNRGLPLQNRFRDTSPRACRVAR